MLPFFNRRNREKKSALSIITTTTKVHITGGGVPPLSCRYPLPPHKNETGRCPYRVLLEATQRGRQCSCRHIYRNWRLTRFRFCYFTLVCWTSNHNVGHINLIGMCGCCAVIQRSHQYCNCNCGFANSLLDLNKSDSFE